jgi:hypothetical protein
MMSQRDQPESRTPIEQAGRDSSEVTPVTRLEKMANKVAIKGERMTETSSKTAIAAEAMIMAAMTIEMMVGAMSLTEIVAMAETTTAQTIATDMIRLATAGLEPEATIGMTKTIEEIRTQHHTDVLTQTSFTLIEVITTSTSGEVTLGAFTGGAGTTQHISHTGTGFT